MEENKEMVMGNMYFQYVVVLWKGTRRYRLTDDDKSAAFILAIFFYS